MRIFHEEHPWPTKVNFIDDRGTALGFDTQDDCCANGGWYIADKPDQHGSEIEEAFKMESSIMEGWRFDPSYFKEYPEADGSYDEGDRHEYRIVHEDSGKEKFITLYNHHNGYYSKGFEFRCDWDKTKNREGSI